MLFSQAIQEVEFESYRQGPFRAAARKGLLAFALGQELGDNPYGVLHPVSKAFMDSWREGWRFGQEKSMSISMT